MNEPILRLSRCSFSAKIIKEMAEVSTFYLKFHIRSSLLFHVVVEDAE